MRWYSINRKTVYKVRQKISNTSTSTLGVHLCSALTMQTNVILIPTTIIMISLPCFLVPERKLSAIMRVIPYTNAVWLSFLDSLRKLSHASDVIPWGGRWWRRWTECRHPCRWDEVGVSRWWRHRSLFGDPSPEWTGLIPAHSKVKMRVITIRLADQVLKSNLLHGLSIIVNRRFWKAIFTTP